MHPVSQNDEALQQQCQVQRTRGSGPGGQHRNKVETAIVVTHRPTGVIGQASEKRSQHANLVEALFRLRLKLAVEIRSSPLPQSAGNLWQGRIKNRRISINSSHADFPMLLVDALDQIQRLDHDLPAAAAALGISGSQLVKFLKSHPPAWDRIQQTRESRGMRRLK